MREILFRGKRTVTGKWAYGYPVKRPSACYIGAHTPWAIIVPPKDPDDRGGEYWIDYETVGQYTGLTDRNGKKIFEGDIVRCFNKRKNPGASVLGSVYWHEQACLFARTDAEDGWIYMCDSQIYEVIGNIYDNTELLKKGW